MTSALTVGSHSISAVYGGDANYDGSTSAVLSQVVNPPPTVVTGGASGITAAGATLNGTANPNGTATTASFEYGLTTSYGSTTPAQNMGSGNVAVAIGDSIAGLTCNALYHFRAVATNPSGTTNGLDATFTTAACPPVVQSQGPNFGTRDRKSVV